MWRLSGVMTPPPPPHSLNPTSDRVCGQLLPTVPPEPVVPFLLQACPLRTCSLPQMVIKWCPRGEVDAKWMCYALSFGCYVQCFDQGRWMGTPTCSLFSVQAFCLICWVTKKKNPCTPPLGHLISRL
mmetsp:Transcript_95400/g.164629  ORF Transcript_95400/g.164629 Transcript_95400/m.164629 type:complete len:127 (-) Transcript_95400:333-713(-)